MLRATTSLITSSTSYYSTRKHSLAHNEPTSFSKKKKTLTNNTLCVEKHITTTTHTHKPQPVTITTAVTADIQYMLSECSVFKCS